MRGIWVDAGNDPDYARLQTHGITEVVFDLRDERLTKTYLGQVSGHGLKVGVYAAWNWGIWSGAEFSEWVNELVTPLNTSQNTPFVHLNAETHDVVWLLAMLKRWRQLRPQKRTLWTMEGMQGGLFNAAAVVEIESRNVEYGPQCYTGDMTRMESATVVLDLVSRGFSAKRIRPFLDASQLGYWWDGVAYTQGRLS